MKEKKKTATNAKEEFFKEIISFVKKEKPDRKKLAFQKNQLCKKYNLPQLSTNIEILLNAKREDLDVLKKYLLTKPVRTISGVAVVAIMTKPFPCPHGTCTMCPGGVGSVFGDVPQSYTGNEPATMRAIRNKFDSYLQVFNRLEQYVVIGQNPDKVDMIIMGGTFPFMSIKYQDEFIYFAFKALNDFSKMFYKNGELDIVAFKDFFELPGPVGEQSRLEKVHAKLLDLKEKGRKTLEEEQTENETALIRCIGLTIETKPDYAKLIHANQMLKLGCTRVELGVQSIYDDALLAINRGHNSKDAIEAIKILKDLGFKLNYHMMLGLPGVDKKRDVESLKTIVKSKDYQPDMLKLYPCMVMPGTELFKDWQSGKFTPISTMEAAERIAEFKKYVPEYVRIMRVQRDIPTKFSKDGVDKNNLRQIIETITKKKKIVCRCIRCREIKSVEITEDPKLNVIEYPASDGKEFFISFDTKDDKIVGFCRVRIPNETLRPEITSKSALLRELHIYGTAVKIGNTSKDGKAQHKGFGRRLVEEAEKIALKNKRVKMVVISGVGVRGYYRMLGYEKEGPYMVKNLK